MTSTSTVGVLAALLVLGACAEAPNASSVNTEATSRDLLSSSTAGAASTAQQERRRIDIGELGFTQGAEDAPVRVIEMSDYGCGYCRQFHEETWPQLREVFVATGKVQWKFIPFVNGLFENSPYATETAECALEQGVAPFQAVNARLWEDQRTWKGSDDPEPVLRAYAQEAGLDLDRYDSCLSEDRRVDRINAAMALSRQAGVRGTPTFFVVGYPPIQGALPSDVFQRVLTLVYEDATKGDGGSQDR